MGSSSTRCPVGPTAGSTPYHHDLYPPDPAPGLYAISANLIQGRNLADPETYAWFREREADRQGGLFDLYL